MDFVFLFLLFRAGMLHVWCAFVSEFCNKWTLHRHAHVMCGCLDFRIPVKFDISPLEQVYNKSKGPFSISFYQPNFDSLGHSFFRLLLLLSALPACGYIMIVRRYDLRHN